jgi:agmatinase
MPQPRYGAQFGPDITFLGVPRCDWQDEASMAGADVVVLGAPFDGGTSHRPGTRFGPYAIRATDYLPHDGSRPSLALRTDGLQDLDVRDAGDVEMPPGDIETSLTRLRGAVAAVARTGAVPVVLGGDHSITYATGRGTADAHGDGRVSMLHFDAHADTGDIEFGSLWGHGQPMRRLIESGALRGDRFLQLGLRGYWPGPETLAWMAAQRMRSFEMTEIGHRGLGTCLDEAFGLATDGCDGVFLGAAGGGGRRRGGEPSLRPRRHHRRPGQPGGARGAVRHGAASAGGGGRGLPRPGRSAARRPLSRSGRGAGAGTQHARGRLPCAWVSGRESPGLHHSPLRAATRREALPVRHPLTTTSAVPAPGGGAGAVPAS